MKAQETQNYFKMYFTDQKSCQRAWIHSKGFHLTIFFIFLLDVFLQELLPTPGHSNRADDNNKEEICNSQDNTGRQDHRVAVIFCDCSNHIHPWSFYRNFFKVFALWDVAVLPRPSLPGKTPNFVSLICAEFFRFFWVPTVVVVVVGHHPL